MEKHENVEGVDESFVELLKQRNLNLEQDLNRLKANCDKYSFQQFESSSTSNAVKSKPISVKNFSEQIPINQNVYRIVNNSTARSAFTNSNYYSPAKAVHNKNNGHLTKNNKKIHDSKLENGIINSVENFQIAQQPILLGHEGITDTYKNKEDEANVLAQPQIMNKGSTTTTTESPKARSSSQISAREQNKLVKLVAPPILQAPTVKESKSSTPLKKERRLPEGVVPVPETSWLNKEPQQDNRYSNAIEEERIGIAGHETDTKNGNNLNFLIANEQENLAHEVPDNDFNIDEKKVNPENPGGLGEDKIDNNAEEDTNIYDTNKDVFNTNNKDILHNSRRSGNADTKLRNEVVGDHGKEGDHYNDEDLRIEGQNEEEGDSKPLSFKSVLILLKQSIYLSVGDYDDPNAMKQGPAERTK